MITDDRIICKTSVWSAWITLTIDLHKNMMN